MFKTIEDIVNDNKDIPIPYNDANWVNNENQFEKILSLNPHIKTVVEIGPFIGAGSTRIFGKYVKDRSGTLICVDTFDIDADPGLRGWCIQCKFTFPLDNMYGQFLSNMTHHGLSSCIIPFQGESSNFFDSKLASLYRDKVDLVYIDGNHRYEYVKADIKNTIKAFPNALICGDDWEEVCWKNDVQRAVTEVAQELKLTMYTEKNFWIIHQ